MEKSYRKKLIAWVTFLGGIYFFLEFVLPESFLKRIHVADAHEQITLGFVTIGLMAFGLGIINLLMIHGARIIFLRKGWSNSLALICGLFLMVACAILDWSADRSVDGGSRNLNMLFDFSRKIAEDHQKGTAGVPPLDFRIAKLVEAGRAELDGPQPAVPAARAAVPGADPARDYDEKKQALARALNSLEAQADPEESLKNLDQVSAAMSELLAVKRLFLKDAASQRPGKRTYRFLFDGLFVSLGSALFSLLGVYIAAAAYRAFRIKTFESSLMMAAALIVMLGQIPFGLWIYEGMPELRGWLLEVPNSGASRAIRIGALIAGLVLAFRMWFSIESDSFSGDGK